MRRIALALTVVGLLVAPAAPALAGGGGHSVECTRPRTAGGTAVAMKDFCFDPAVLTIPAGTNVRFISYDAVPHTVTSKDGVGGLDLKFEQGDYAVVRFASAGRYTYVCVLHPGMKAEIRVGSSTAAGKASGISIVSQGKDESFADDGVLPPIPVPTNTLNDALSPAKLAAEAAAKVAAERSARPNRAAWSLVALLPLAGLTWFEIRRHRRTAE